MNTAGAVVFFNLKNKKKLKNIKIYFLIFRTRILLHVEKRMRGFF